jgi:hypothetical protein
VLAVACALIAFAPRAASAQEDEGPNQVTGTAKGIVGGALLGAEVVMIPMGAAGLKPWWPYVVFGSVGAVGGAVGGWAVEQAVADDGPAEAPLYMLAGGLALIIPTVVLSLNATTKDQFEDTADPATTTTTTPPGEPPATTTPGANPGGGDGTTTIQVQPDARNHPKNNHKKKKSPAPLRGALFDLAGSEVRVGVPAIVVKNMYSNDEMAKFGVEQQTEVRVPFVSASF